MNHDIDRGSSKILQCSPTIGQSCGIANFASALARNLSALGYESDVSARLPAEGISLAMIHYHPDLWNEEDLIEIKRSVDYPVVIVPHEQGDQLRQIEFDGYLQLGTDWRSLGSKSTSPSVLLGHPAWVPSSLQDRSELRCELGLPIDRTIVGTSGYLRNDRQFPEICRSLIDDPALSDTYIYLVTTEWRDSSQHLLSELDRLVEHFPDRIMVERRQKSRVELNNRLQACDLLWSWSQVDDAVRSRNFLSGAVVDQYASGTRVLCANVPEHRSVAHLPNVALSKARNAVDFSGDIANEILTWRSSIPRHDPSAVSWTHQAGPLDEFIQTVLSSRRYK